MYHKITTKHLDLPRNFARFCNGLQWSVIPRRFGVNHEFTGLLIRFLVGRFSRFGTKRSLVQIQSPRLTTEVVATIRLMTSAATAAEVVSWAMSARQLAKRSMPRWHSPSGCRELRCAAGGRARHPHRISWWSGRLEANGENLTCHLAHGLVG
jgi:hypothetical protein